MPRVRGAIKLPESTIMIGDGLRDCMRGIRYALQWLYNICVYFRISAAFKLTIVDFFAKIGEFIAPTAFCRKDDFQLVNGI